MHWPAYSPTCKRTRPHMHTQEHTCVHAHTALHGGAGFLLLLCVPVFFPSPRALHPAQGRRCRGAWSAWAATSSSQPAGHLGGLWKEPAGAGGPPGILMELARGGACTQETQTCHLSQARVGPGRLGSPHRSTGCPEMRALASSS